MYGEAGEKPMKKIDAPRPTTPASAGEKPRMFCCSRVCCIIEPLSVMPSTMSKMIVAGIGAAFSSFQGTIGAEERFCWNTMMSTTTRPAATGPHTCGLENLSDSACDKPVHTSTSAAVSRPAPSQSMRPPRGS